AQPPAVAGAEPGRDVVEILHRPDVDPQFRHRDDEVRAPEPEPGEDKDAPAPVRDRLAHQVLAGDAEMDVAGGKLAGDLSRGGDGARARAAPDAAAAIAARVALLHAEARADEKRLGILHHAALGGQRENERAHRPASGSWSRRMVKPTPGVGPRAPSISSRRS